MEKSAVLRSIVLELKAVNQLSHSTVASGNKSQALFLNIIQQIDPALNKRLHDEYGYRPFTTSLLTNSPNFKEYSERSFRPHLGQTYYLRITMFDEGQIWDAISTIYINGNIILRLGNLEFIIKRLFSTPVSTPVNHWADFSSWEKLVDSSATEHITIRFVSPTAFHMGKRHFNFYPHPIWVWDSLIRVWNNYAPLDLRVDKISLRKFITENVKLVDCKLSTVPLLYPVYTETQKGFTGTCTYRLLRLEDLSAQVTYLSKFAYYAGIGYKTTMGMGQALSEGIN
jgi:CRISPR-associated endoribonuclease Cas6